MMVGRPITLQVEKKPIQKGDTVLKVENLCTHNHSRRGNLRGISFEVHRGEIFGIAGVDGNGQSELVGAIMGLHKLDQGRVMILGNNTTHWSTGKIRQLSLAYIPEERQKAGLVMKFPVRNNLVLSTIKREPFGTWWRINRSALQTHAKDLIRRFRIYTPSQMTLVEKLSGGNQQRVVLAREVAKNVDLIIAGQATRGLDVDATRFVFDIILTARENGAGILYISTELEEIMTLSDTIGIIYEGQLTGILPAEQANINTVGMLMAGERQSAK